MKLWPHDHVTSVSRRRSGPIASVVVIIVPLGASGTALVKEHHGLMRRDFEALLTSLAGHIIIYSDEVIS